MMKQMNNKEDIMLVDGLKAQLILARIKETKEISDEDVLFLNSIIVALMSKVMGFQEKYEKNTDSDEAEYNELLNILM